MTWKLIDGQIAWVNDVQSTIRAVAMFTPRLDGYRIYDDDGGEAASTALELDDTPHDLNVDSDQSVQIRVMIQETGGTDGSSMDDYQLQYNKNGAGLLSVPTSDTGDGISAGTAGLTNDAATTNRASEPLADGTGTFVAGEQSTDGLVDDLLLTTNNFTELVFGVTFYNANLANNDSFVFSVSMTNKAADAVSPTITIDITPPVASGTGWETAGWF